MKRLILLAAVSAIGFSVRAQTEKGKLMIGGAVSLLSTKTEQSSVNSQEVNSFSVIPSVGYFVADNFVVGSKLGYFQANYFNRYSAPDYFNTSLKTKQQTIIVSPFGRYYAKINDQFSFFGDLSVPMNFSKLSNKPENADRYAKYAKSDAIGIALSPGFAFFPAPKFGIEFAVRGISYNDLRYKDYSVENQDNTNKTFSVGANFFSPSIGVQYYF